MGPFFCSSVPGVIGEVFVEEDVDAALQERGVVESLRAQTVTLDPRVVPLQWNALFQMWLIQQLMKTITGSLIEML